MDIKNIQEIYALSSVQEAMLLDCLHSEKTGWYCGQLICELHGDLNVLALERAWQQVVDRHPVLRTFFVWKRLDNPRQVVQRQLELLVKKLDWYCLSAAKQQEQLETLIQEDRSRGFDPSEAPLIRVTLCRTSDDSEDVHQLICTYSHLVLDCCSFYLILNQVFTYYEGFCQGQDLQLKQSCLYQDYITWFERQDMSKAEAFWRHALEGFSVPTTLGVERTPGSEPHLDEGYAEQQLKMSAAATAKLQSLAGEHQLSLNTILQGAWAVLLSRYSGEEDVVFGTTVSGRPPNLQGSKSIVGPFINTLPVRIRVFPNSPVLSWLKELQIQQVNLHQYEYSSLIQVREWSDVPKDLPLFESSIALESFSVEDFLHRHSVSINIRNIQTFGQINSPITVKAWLNPELTLQIIYNRYSFNDSTITRMLKHLETLLEGIVVHLDQCLSTLPLLSDPELRQLLFEWNNTNTDYPEDRCIHQLFEAQVEQTSEAIAVVFEEKQLTYGDLNCRANQLAHYLQTLGVGPEVLVGICTERSLEMVVGLLGILKAGSAYLPLDPTYPFERLSFMLEDAQPPVLLTQERLLEKLPSHWAQVVCLDSDWEAIASESEENPSSGATPKNLAYTIYTSGSTGTPKGVLITHQGLCNLASVQIQTFGVQPSSHVLQFASLSFDASTWEIVMALCSGAKLYLGTPDSLLPGANLMQMLYQQAITHATLPPSVLATLRPDELLALEVIIVAGEACGSDLIAQWSGERRFFNAYGPTESTVCATVAEISNNTQKPHIGRPIANTQIYILDRHLQPVPIGVPGELHISGISLARGYLNRPNLTEEKFIFNPFSNVPKSRLYKTGDLARYLSNGNIEFLGRIDHQVKIRGFRIELGEIEAVLTKHPEVLEAIVIAREDQLSNKRLVAYVVPKLEKNGSQDNLVQYLRDYLKNFVPNYMIPAAFVFLETLPLTPNGKVDRRALKAPDTDRPKLESTYVMPQTPVEKVLAEIWADVLGVKQVGINDNFFELGGDSILSVQVVSRANQAGLLLTPKQIVGNQTIAKLATVAGTTKAVLAEQGLVTGALPLTPIQHWFFEQSLPNPHHYNQSVLLAVPPDLKPDILEQVLLQLLLHHDALRLRFIHSGEGWQQVNATFEKTEPLSVVDVSAISSEQQVAALEATGSELQASLNLFTGPLMRAALFYFGIDQPSRLLLIIHHLAVDGISWRILLEDLFNAYEQISHGEAIQLPPKTSSFKDWAYSLAKYGQSEALMEELDYWLVESGAIRKASNLQLITTSLPVDYVVGKDANTIASASVITKHLSIEKTHTLLQVVPSIYNTQINDVLLTALVQSFAQWSREYSLLIHLEGHGREELFEDVDLSRTVGWFTTLFPIHLKLEKESNLGESLKSVKEQLRCLPKRGIGYGVLRYLSQNAQLIQAWPQAEVSFNYLGQLDQELSKSSVWAFASESTKAEHHSQENRSYLLEVNGLVINGQLQIKWTYSTQIHQESTIERLSQWFIDALHNLIDYCQSPNVGGYTPSDFPEANLNQQELDDIMSEFQVLQD